jgi:hypothetical protein
MSAFLAKWTNIEPERPAEQGPMPPAPLAAVHAYYPAASWAEGRAQEPGASEGAEHEQGVSWAEWKAAALNRLFQELGVTGQPGRITDATVRHGEASRNRVDSVAKPERPMSGAEALAE